MRETQNKQSDHNLRDVYDWESRIYMMSSITRTKPCNHITACLLLFPLIDHCNAN
jgi:hypothetical protein